MSPAEQAWMPEASRDRSSGTFGRQISPYSVLRYVKHFKSLLFDAVLVSALVITVPMLSPFPPSGLSPDQIFNFAEGWLWTIIALVFALQANRKTNKYRKLAGLASIAFFAFGVSDFIEFTTGAWYRPWSLFVFKALCVLGFLFLLRQYSIAKRHENK